MEHVFQCQIDVIGESCSVADIVERLFRLRGIALSAFHHSLRIVEQDLGITDVVPRVGGVNNGLLRQEFANPEACAVPVSGIVVINFVESGKIAFALGAQSEIIFTPLRYLLVRIESRLSLRIDDSALDDDLDPAEVAAGIHHPCFETGILVGERIFKSVVLNIIHRRIEGRRRLGDQGHIGIFLPVLTGFDCSVLPCAARTVVVESIHHVQGDRVSSPLPSCAAGMRLLRRIPEVETVGGSRNTRLVTPSEDEFRILSCKKQVVQVVRSLGDIGRSPAVERELTGIHDRLAGLDTLLVISVRVGRLHVGQFFRDGLIFIPKSRAIPVFTHRRGVERDAGLKSERRPFRRAVGAVIPGSGKQGDRLVEFRNDEIPGFLLRASRNIQAQILAPVILLIQRFGDNRHTAERSDGSEIHIGADEKGFPHHGISGFLTDHIIFQGFIQLLDQHIDRADLGKTPVRSHINGISASMRIGSVHGGLVKDTESIHRDLVVGIGKQPLQTGNSGDHIFLRHPGEVSFEVVKELVARNEKQAEADDRSIFEEFVHGVHY